MSDLSQIPIDQLLQMLQQHPDAIVVPLAAPVAAPSPPATQNQKLMASPLGQAYGGAAQGLYGLNQDIYKIGQGVTSLGGLYPNPVSNVLGGAADQQGELAKQSADSYANARAATGKTGFSPGNFVGEVASPANWLASDVKLPAAAVRVLGKSAKLGSVLLKGGAYGTTSPVDPNSDFATTKAEQAGLGAALGYGGDLLGKAANPMASVNPHVATLLRAGVPLTAGQILGGLPRTLEDAATSIPFVGDLVKSRQRDALQGLNTAVINRSLAPIGEKLPSALAGHEAIQYATDKLGDAYDKTLEAMSATADPQLTGDLTALVNNGVRDYGLSADKQKQFFSILQAQMGKADKGYFDGATLKDVQSNLSYQARNFAKSADPDQRNLSDALFDARDTFNDFIARQNPTQAPQLKAINTGYANFVRAQSAAASSKTGIFSPSELGRAVKAGGTKSTNATGKSLMQDLSTAGQAVLPSTVPDSGTPLRHAVQIAALLAAGGGAEHFGEENIGIGTLATGAALGLGASKPAQYLARALLTKRPYGTVTAAALAKGLQYAPVLSAGVNPLITGPNP